MQTETLDSGNKKLSFWEFLSIVKWAVAFNFKLSPWLTPIQAVIQIIVSTAPILNAYIFARLIDGVIQVAAAGEDLNAVFPLLGFLLAYNIILTTLNSIYSYISIAQAHKYMFHVPMILGDKIHSLGIQTLENPEVVNKIQRSKESIGSLNADFERFITLISYTILLGSTFSIVVHILPAVALIVVLAMIPEVISNKIFTRKIWSFWRSHTEERRKTNYLISAINETSNIQEISITGAFHPMRNIFAKFARIYETGYLKLTRQSQSVGLFLGTFTDIASIFGYFTILKNLFHKLISVGDVTFQMRILDMFVTNISRVVNGFAQAYERAIRIKEVKDVFDMEPMVKDGRVILPKSNVPPEITLANVSFKYPNAEKFAVQNVSLSIKSGEKIAIVGENGAGKTTLIKLLSRFYKTTEGSVMLDGTSINDIAIASWYEHLGVLFQDYNTYGVLSAKQNIYLGRGNEPMDMEAVKKAAQSADIADTIEGYKDGYDQILNEKFKGGTRPSTGQWQKIAIARFFYRNSPVVIFDEPTASIDAISEAEIFGKIYRFFTGKTVIIISHRFSTVRNADRIYVLDKGQIVESGNHEELMKLKGKYYKAFITQAEGYK